MANIKSRSNAPKSASTKKGRGRIKKSSAGKVTCKSDSGVKNTAVLKNSDASKNCPQPNQVVFEVPITNADIIDKDLKTPGHVITRSGKIRNKSKEDSKTMDNIIKIEVELIEDNSKNRNMRNQKGPTVNGVNNNDIELNDQNTENTPLGLTSNLKTPNSKMRTIGKGIIKVKRADKINKLIESKKTKENLALEQDLRENVISKMKSILSTDDVAFTEKEMKTKKYVRRRPRNPVRNKSGMTKTDPEEPTAKDKPKKRRIETPPTKQVTLSNGVVLTLTLAMCDYCQKSFSSKSSLGRHMLSHLNIKPHNCPKCTKKFRYQSTLRIHLQRCHPIGGEDSELYTCHVCNKAFLMQENLELHLATHIKAEKEFKCIYCKKIFSHKLLLTQHEKVHLVTGRFKCYLCDMTYNCRSRLSHHIKIHTQIKEYICQYCGKEFLRLNSIKRHVRVCHSGYRVQCPVCLKYLKGHLAEHMRVHEQKRPHVCTVCGQRFTQSTQLTVHKRSHTGDRPYVCRICNRPFGHSNALMLHTRRHTGEKPFPCPMCPISFSQLPHMKSHMSRIHGKENPYKCEKCDEFFKMKIDLKTHEKTCSVGEKELSFEEKIEASVRQSEEPAIESVMSLSKMRFHLALLLTMIASKDRLKYLGFNKRLIDDLLVESLEAMGHNPTKDESLSTLMRLKTNIEILLQGTVPKEQMEKFKSENKTTEELLVLLTEDKKIETVCTT